MSPKRGWIVHERGSKWLARAWDKRTRKYRNKTFSNPVDAEEWAKLEHARFITGQATAGHASLATIAGEYLAELQRQGASEGHFVQTKRVADRAAAEGLDNVSDARAAVIKARAILEKLKRPNGEPSSPVTRNNFLKMLRSFGNFGVRHGHITFNPFIRLDCVPVVKPLKAVFTLIELGKLVDPAHEEDPFYRAFAALIYTGFRASEMRHMDYEWLLWDDRRIQMIIDKKARSRIGSHGYAPKGKTERRARITRLMDELVEILKPDSHRSGPVFPELRGLTNASFQTRFNAYLRRCGVEVGERTPHSTRHTWTCLMLASEESPVLVQQYTGHSQREMTAHYAKQMDLYVRKVLKAGWPRGELRLRDFSPGGKCWLSETGQLPLVMPKAAKPA